jgi:hypothetical protein
MGTSLEISARRTGLSAVTEPDMSSGQDKEIIDGHITTGRKAAKPKGVTSIGTQPTTTDRISRTAF